MHHPRTPADLRARQRLWDNVRAAKESLSRQGATFVHVPLLDVEVPLGREQLEALAMPILDRTVGVALGVLREAGAVPDAVHRVGGSSRVPLVATLLHQRFGLPAAPIDQPDLAVALGTPDGARRRAGHRARDGARERARGTARDRARRTARDRARRTARDRAR
ncbi:Hsp70 family protein, partial [Dactylosporangium sp. NPDC049742]|uniref:Hsp70 family protein n=1 Tax=Dactylosporangium sp. NPDC049742 TaxID=3154737 RepID=UPI003435E482